MESSQSNLLEVIALWQMADALYQNGYHTRQTHNQPTTLK
jgi:hypothetical protein